MPLLNIRVFKPLKVIFAPNLTGFSQFLFIHCQVLHKSTFYDHLISCLLTLTLNWSMRLKPADMTYIVLTKKEENNCKKVIRLAAPLKDWLSDSFNLFTQVHPLNVGIISSSKYLMLNTVLNEPLLRVSTYIHYIQQAK